MAHRVWYLTSLPMKHKFFWDVILFILVFVNLFMPIIFFSACCFSWYLLFSKSIQMNSPYQLYFYVVHHLSTPSFHYKCWKIYLLFNCGGWHSLQSYCTMYNFILLHPSALCTWLLFPIFFEYLGWRNNQLKLFCSST